MKHFNLKHMLRLFLLLLGSFFSYFVASVKQYCLCRLVTKADEGHSRRRHRHCTEKHTCLSELSAIIRVILIYKSALSTYTHCRKASSYFGFRWSTCKNPSELHLGHTITPQQQHVFLHVQWHKVPFNKTRTLIHYSVLAQHFSV